MYADISISEQSEYFIKIKCLDWSIYKLCALYSCFVTGCQVTLSTY